MTRQHRANVKSDPRKLLIVPSDPLHALKAKGYDDEWLRRYYNPDGHFDEVRVLNLFAEADIPLPALDVNVSDDMHAWRESNSNPWAYNEVAIETLRDSCPGLDPAWVESAREYAPDCVRAYDPAWSGLIAVDLAAALGVPCLVSVHNTRGLCADVLKGADFVMSVSEGVATRCLQLGVAPHKLVTVFNRVNRNVFTPDGPAADGLDGAPKLLSVARDGEQKNLNRVLEACTKAANTHPELQLVHIGNSNRDWSKWSFARHIDSVPHDEIASWMRWADALILPSLYEGFGVVLAEAHACGLPCITANREPMNEIVTDRWDGLLVDPEQVSDIEGAIKMIGNAATQARLAAPARTSSERFDIAVVEKRESGLYQELTRRDWLKVSVVLPTFNRADKARAAIQNVLGLDYPNLELIVVNDGSEDGTREMLDEINDERVRVIHHDNRGLPRALNAGFAIADGEYWTWTSDDNAYREGAIQAMARELQLDPGAGLVCASMEIVDEHGQSRIANPGPPEKLDEGNSIGACFLYRASVARAVGEYDPAYALAEDYDYWLRMRKQTSFVRLKRVLYTYADHPGNLTRQRHPQVQEAHLRLLQREHAGRAELDQRLFEHLCRYASASKQYGLTGASVGASWRAIRQRPSSAVGWKSLLRALTPMPLLRLTRRLRGLDAS